MTEFVDYLTLLVLLVLLTIIPLTVATLLPGAIREAASRTSGVASEGGAKGLVAVALELINRVFLAGVPAAAVALLTFSTTFPIAHEWTDAGFSTSLIPQGITIVFARAFRCLHRDYVIWSIGRILYAGLPAGLVALTVGLVFCFGSGRKAQAWPAC